MPDTSLPPAPPGGTYRRDPETGGLILTFHNDESRRRFMDEDLRDRRESLDTAWRSYREELRDWRLRNPSASKRFTGRSQPLRERGAAIEGIALLFGTPGRGIRHRSGFVSSAVALPGSLITTGTVALHRGRVVGRVGDGLDFPRSRAALRFTLNPSESLPRGPLVVVPDVEVLYGHPSADALSLGRVATFEIERARLHSIELFAVGSSVPDALFSGFADRARSR